MERNVMGELNVYRGSGAKPNFSEIARRHGMDRHTVAKYWRDGESAADGRSARGSAALDMERAIEASLEENCPALLAMYGCGPVSAAKLAVAAGDNPGRLRSEASFAAICGALLASI